MLLSGFSKQTATHLARRTPTVTLEAAARSEALTGNTLTTKRCKPSKGYI